MEESKVCIDEMKVFVQETVGIKMLHFHLKINFKL